VSACRNNFSTEKKGKSGFALDALRKTLQQAGLRWLKMKISKVVSFWFNTQTPISLTLDAVRLKRRSFISICNDGVKLRLAPSKGESFTLYEVLIRRDYLSTGVSLNHGDTVVDVGANIGAFTMQAAKIVGPGGRVISIEPAPDSASRLEENISLNNLTNVETIRVAIS
jgi:23S rRNA G2069 N7-methylase RlmK/C1962 C5-methylase RlmI